MENTNRLKYSTGIEFKDWGGCFYDFNKKLIKKREVQSSCTHDLKGLFQITECSKKYESKANEVTHTEGAFDRNTGKCKNEKNESCYPVFILIILIIYSIISTSSCCWLFFCAFRIKKRKKKKDRIEVKLKLDNNHDYQNAATESV